MDHIKQTLSKLAKPTHLCAALAALLIAGILADTAIWGSLSAMGNAAEPVYQPTNTLTIPTFEPNDFILSKSARLTLPALELA